MDTMNSYSIISIQTVNVKESSRDQGHVLAGIHNYVAIAEMAWNQGDSLYNCLNNRLLLGLEWNYRYNLSKVQTYEEQKELGNRQVIVRIQMKLPLRTENFSR